MITHRIIDILRTFSDEEIRRFRDFLRSPFFNRSKQLLKVYNIISYYHPDFNSARLTKMYIHEKIYPNSHYKESTVLNLLANMSYLAEDFLMYTNIQNNYLKSQDFLLDEILKRKLFKLFEKNALEFEEILKDNRGIDENQILSSFYFDTDKYNYNLISKTFAGKQTHEENIELLTKRGKHIIFYFIMQLIKHNLGLYTYQFNYDVDIEDNFLINFSKNINLEEILNYLCAKTDEEDYLKIAETYKYLYLMFSDFEDEKHYYNFKKCFVQNSNLFNYSEKQFLSTILIQYCLSKNRVLSTESKYNKELFDIYILIIENEYYKSTYSDFFPVQLFRNIILMGIRLKKYKWTEDFINSKRKKLHPEQRKNMYHYSYAKLYFERGVYRKALTEFNKIILSSSIFKVDIRNMMLKTYYELNLTESAYSLIDSYKHFLRNDKTISVERKSSYRSFVIITQKLLEARETGKKPLLTYIEGRLKEKKNIFDRQWLNEKVFELRQGYKAVV